ncbi:TetR/AcrR family transcriptional regulator [Nocardioides marmoribigeumensis]
MAHMTRTRLSPVERRAQLLDLGMVLLAERGLDDLSIDVLAEHAGISRGLLYHYFSDKRDFHLAVLRRMSEEVVAITAPPTGGTPMTRMMASLEAYVGFVGTNRAAYASFLRAARSGDAEFHQIYEESRTALLDRIFEVSDAEELAALGLYDDPRGHLLVRGWSALVEETVMAWLEDPAGLSREELLTLLTAALPGITLAVQPTPR